MKALHFVDTTLRDGNTSLWAGALRTDMLLPIIDKLDQVGYQAMEIVDVAFFKKMVRDLKDDPWERIRRVSAACPNTPLRVITSRHLTFEYSAPEIDRLFVERLAANGVRQVRISDPSNTSANWERLVINARNAGLDSILNLIFSISPLHTDDSYRHLARAAAALRPTRICLKDPGGLLTPDRMRTLVPAVLAETGDIPLEFHTHCNTGMGPLCVLEAIKLGVEIVNTGTPPLANGSANPSVFNIAANARELGFEPSINLDAVTAISDHLMSVAHREGLPIGAPLEYTESHYAHQVPGGMISNFRHQLAQAGMLSRLPEVIEEVKRVRSDLGYPIMVTPYSQFVGVQAVFNVMLGERYKEVSDQILQYALGVWGAAERDAVDPNVRERIVSRPRAREVAAWVPPQTTLAEFRTQFGGGGVDDDEMLLRYFAGIDETDAMRRAPLRPGGLDAHQPLTRLIEALGKKKNFGQLRIEKSGMVIQLGRTASAPA
jgi:oxaloacetate decarboxylase (Na+ extruding) subunit alpha